ncbi:MAG: hypothetical protein Q9202_005638 [Teloschistes flavicans]
MLRRMSPVAKDPLSILPFEIAKLVMECLTFQQMVPLTRVSKRWRDFLQSIPNLWTRLDFADTGHVSRTALQKYIRYSENKVTDIVVTKYHHRVLLSLQHVIRQLPRLQHLHIGIYHDLQTILLAENLQSLVLSDLDFGISLSEVELILCRCTALKSAEFHYVCRPVAALSFPSVLSLRSLYMSFRISPRGVEQYNIERLLEKASEVQNLILENLNIGLHVMSSPNVTTMTHLELLRLRNCLGALSPQALPSLRVLEVSNSQGVILPWGNGNTPDNQRPSLLELIIKNDHVIDARLITELLGSRTEKLKRFNISGCTNVDPLGLVESMHERFLDQVVDLDLSATRVNDKVIEKLALNLQELNRISLEKTEITGIAVRVLIMKPGAELEYLNISECAKISPDAVEFARKQQGLILKSGNGSVAKGKKQFMADENRRRVRYLAAHNRSRGGLPTSTVDFAVTVGSDGMEGSTCSESA